MSNLSAKNGNKSKINKCLRKSLLHLKKRLRWYNHRLNEGKTKFKEIGRWFFGKSLQDVDENNIIVGIGYFMRKNYN